MDSSSVDRCSLPRRSNISVCGRNPSRFFFSILFSSVNRSTVRDSVPGLSLLTSLPSSLSTIGPGTRDIRSMVKGVYRRCRDLFLERHLMVGPQITGDSTGLMFQKLHARARLVQPVITGPSFSSKWFSLIKEPSRGMRKPLSVLTAHWPQLGRKGRNFRNPRPVVMARAEGRKGSFGLGTRHHGYKRKCFSESRSFTRGSNPWSGGDNRSERKEQDAVIF